MDTELRQLIFQLEQAVASRERLRVEADQADGAVSEARAALLAHTEKE